jgi:predicted ATPase
VPKAKRKSAGESALDEDVGFITRVELRQDRVPDWDVYPFNIPAVRALKDGLELHPKVTYLVGENGSGKSTLLEAIAVAAGFNAEGGSRNFNFTTRGSESNLAGTLRLWKSHRRPRTGYFLRAESFFNVATEIEVRDREAPFGPPIIDSYGGQSLHEVSHGESIQALMKNRFSKAGLYLLDEVESALSCARQVEALTRIDQLAKEGSQLVIATHSPIILRADNALIYELSNEGLAVIEYSRTPAVTVMRRFLSNAKS